MLSTVFSIRHSHHLHYIIQSELETEQKNEESRLQREHDSTMSALKDDVRSRTEREKTNIQKQHETELEDYKRKIKHEHERDMEQIKQDNDSKYVILISHVYYDLIQLLLIIRAKIQFLTTQYN